MKNRPCLLLLVATIAGFAGVAAAAGTLPLETLPANAKWVLHLDAKALHDSSLGKELLAALPGTPADTSLKAFDATFACDIRCDLTAVTICGSGTVTQGGLVYLRGNWNLRKLSAGLTASHQPTTAAYGRHAILSWVDAKPAEGFVCSIACLVSSNLVLLAKHETTLRQALDTLDGKAPALATVPRFWQLAAMDTNAVLRVVAMDPKELLADLPQAAMLPAADSLRLALQADAQGAHLRGIIQTPNPEAASQMQMELVGLQTVLLMQGLKDPAIATVAQSARIHVTGQEVSVVLSAPLDALKRLVFGQKHGAGSPSAPPVPPTAYPPSQP